MASCWPTPAARRSGRQLMVLGSGSLVAQLAQAGLVDEYQLLLVPVALGRGRTLFEGVDRRPRFFLVSARRFSGGNLLLTCKPPGGLVC